MTYRITGRDGIPAPEFPAAGAQRVEVIEMPAANLIEVETGRSSPVGPAFDRARHQLVILVRPAQFSDVGGHDRVGVQALVVVPTPTHGAQHEEATYIKRELVDRREER